MTDAEARGLLEELVALRAQVEELRRGQDLTLRGGRCRASPAPQEDRRGGETRAPRPLSLIALAKIAPKS